MVAIVLLSAFAFTAPAMAQQNNVISIGEVQVAPGESITTPILINNATSVAGIKVNLSYNPAIVNVTNATLGNFDNSPHKLDLSNAKNGYVKIYVVEYSGLSGNKTVVNVELTGVGSAYATSGLDISLMSLKNDTGLAVTGSTENGTFTIATGCPQSWYLDNDTIMYRGNTPKPEGTVTVVDGNSEIWRADEPARVDVEFSAGIWTGNITLNETFANGNNFTVEVGSSNGTAPNFTSAGSQNFTSDESNTTFSLNVSANSFSVTKDNYLALRITNPSDGSDELVIKTGGNNSYLTSPETDPCYPVPELSTFILFSVGLLALAGYILRKRFWLNFS